MSYKNRWVEPPSRAERNEYRSLRREFKGSRTSKPRRLEIERRLDEIAAKKPESILSELPPAKPTNKDLQALCTRVDVTKRRGSLSEKSIPLAGTPAGLEAFLAKLVGDGREGAIRRAQTATNAERALALLEELPNHPLRKLAEELARYLWQEDKSSPKPDVEQMTRWKVQGWLKREPYNRHDLRGNAETVANAVDDVYRLLAEKDAASVDWYLRRAERLFDGAGTEPTRTPAVDPVPRSAPVNEQYPGQSYWHEHNANIRRAEEAAPEASSAIKSQTDSVSQVNLILQIDSQHLGRLAAHSPALDSQIRGAVALQLQTHGFADGTFLAGLYNAMRMKGCAAFPERKLS